MCATACQSRRVALRLAIFAALALLCPARASWAAEARPLPIQLDFSTQPGCPSLQDFQQIVEARTPIVVDDRAALLRLGVELSTDGVRASGRLRAASFAAAEAREVAGTTCAEVADALALIASLIIERTQRERQALAESRPAPAPRSPAAAPARQVAEPKPALVRLGVEGLVSSATTDSRLAGVGVSVWLQKFLTWSLHASYESNSLLSEPKHVQVGLGALTFGVGPPAWQLGPVQLSAILAGRAGFLTAEGRNVDVPYSVRRSYVAGGLIGRAELELRPRLFAFVHLGGLVPFTTRRFSIREPERVVAQTTRIALDAAFGVALGL